MTNVGRELDDVLRMLPVSAILLVLIRDARPFTQTRNFSLTGAERLNFKQTCLAT